VINSIAVKILSIIGAYRLYWIWRDRGVPALINLRLRWSVRKSSSICDKQNPLIVLIDNTVLRHATTHISGRVSSDDFQTFRSARIPVVDEQQIANENNPKTIAMYESVKFLSGIAYLAEIGAIKLYTSALLQAEQNLQPSGRFRGYGYDDLNLLVGLIQNPIDGYSFSSITGNSFRFPYTKNDIKKFINDSGDDRYREILNVLSASDSQDAYHIRTAEKYEMFCFLTMDYALLEKLNKRKDNKAISSLVTKIWSPADLGHYLKLRPISPYFMSGYRADGPVYNEVNRAGQKATKIQDYDKKQSN
jgi:hypothetical protein